VMANLSVFLKVKALKSQHHCNWCRFLPYAGKLVNLGLLKNESNGIINKGKRLIALQSI
jgi:hypothetical protein